jgi:hypothetical protein
MVSVLFSVLKRTDMRPTPFSFRFNTLAKAEAPFTSKRSSSKSVLPSIASPQYCTQKQFLMRQVNSNWE